MDILSLTRILFPSSRVTQVCRTLTKKHFSESCHWEMSDKDFRDILGEEIYKGFEEVSLESNNSRQIRSGDCSKLIVKPNQIQEGLLPLVCQFMMNFVRHRHSSRVLAHVLSSRRGQLQFEYGNMDGSQRVGHADMVVNSGNSCKDMNYAQGGGDMDAQDGVDVDGWNQGPLRSNNGGDMDAQDGGDVNGWNQGPLRSNKVEVLCTELRDMYLDPQLTVLESICTLKCKSNLPVIWKRHAAQVIAITVLEAYENFGYSLHKSLYPVLYKNISNVQHFAELKQQNHPMLPKFYTMNIIFHVIAILIEEKILVPKNDPFYHRSRSFSLKNSSAPLAKDLRFYYQEEGPFMNLFQVAKQLLLESLPEEQRTHLTATLEVKIRELEAAVVQPAGDVSAPPEAGAAVVQPAGDVSAPPEAGAAVVQPAGDVSAPPEAGAAVVQPAGDVSAPPEAGAADSSNVGSDAINKEVASKDQEVDPINEDDNLTLQEGSAIDQGSQQKNNSQSKSATSTVAQPAAGDGSNAINKEVASKDQEVDPINEDDNLALGEEVDPINEDDNLALGEGSAVDQGSQPRNISQSKSASAVAQAAAAADSSSNVGSNGINEEVASTKDQEADPNNECDNPAIEEGSAIDQGSQPRNISQSKSAVAQAAAAADSSSDVGCNGTGSNGINEEVASKDQEADPNNECDNPAIEEGSATNQGSQPRNISQSKSAVAQAAGAADSSFDVGCNGTGSNGINEEVASKDQEADPNNECDNPAIEEGSATDQGSQPRNISQSKSAVAQAAGAADSSSDVGCNGTGSNGINEEVASKDQEADPNNECDNPAIEEGSATDQGSQLKVDSNDKEVASYNEDHSRMFWNADFTLTSNHDGHGHQYPKSLVEQEEEVSHSKGPFFDLPFPPSLIKRLIDVPREILPNAKALSKVGDNPVIAQTANCEWKWDKEKRCFKVKFLRLPLLKQETFLAHAMLECHEFTVIFQDAFKCIPSEMFFDSLLSKDTPVQAIKFTTCPDHVGFCTQEEAIHYFVPVSSYNEYVKKREAKPTENIELMVWVNDAKTQDDPFPLKLEELKTINVAPTDSIYAYDISPFVYAPMLGDFWSKDSPLAPGVLQAHCLELSVRPLFKPKMFDFLYYRCLSFRHCRFFLTLFKPHII